MCDSKSAAVPDQLVYLFFCCNNQRCVTVICWVLLHVSKQWRSRMCVFVCGLLVAYASSSSVTSPMHWESSTAASTKPLKSSSCRSLFHRWRLRTLSSLSYLLTYLLTCLLSASFKADNIVSDCVGRCRYKITCVTQTSFARKWHCRCAVVQAQIVKNMFQLGCHKHRALVNVK